MAAQGQGSVRWAWVIGGTGGIGAAIADELATQGWQVIASGRGGTELAAAGAGRWTLGADVTDDDAVAVALRRILAHAGRLDAVIVAARSPGQGSFMSMSDAQWRLAIETKLLGYIRVARQVLPVLERSGGSLVSLIGSTAGVATLGHPLGCINAALRHATRGLALEWGPRGVRVVGVSPGPTATPALAGLLRERAAASGAEPAEVERELAGTMFRQQLLRPAEIAALVGFLLGPHGAALNGSIVLADDGATGGCL